MARKRKKLKHLDYNSKAYWEALLKQEHLSMERGRTSKLVYVGSTGDAELVAAISHDMSIKDNPQR